jgi:hypothetical protein
MNFVGFVLEIGKSTAQILEDIITVTNSQRRKIRIINLMLPRQRENWIVTYITILGIMLIVSKSKNVTDSKCFVDMSLTTYYSSFHFKLFKMTLIAEAQKFAKRQLVETEKRMVLLQESRDYSTWTDVEFLKVANEQLVECRRVLKYTYTFAYYLTMPPKTDSIDAVDENLFNSKKEVKKKVFKPLNGKESKIDEEEELGQTKSAQQMQKERFEYHQEMLERFTENLSELVEKPLNEIDRVMVVNQTRVVDRFMKNMLQYVEDGMEETV